MWFPPYSIEINETATAKYESTVMVGRNEPMYNYMNSERSATLSFVLLIDYPEQLKNYDGVDKQKKISEFFAFGGDSYNGNKMNTIENLELKQTKLVDEIKKMGGIVETTEQSTPSTRVIRIAFPNQYPESNDNISAIFDKMYWTYNYEIKEGLKSSDGTGFGLNKGIYFISGVTSTGAGSYVLDSTQSFSQYNQARIIDQYGDECLLNKQLKAVYENVDNRKLYDILITGGASKSGNDVDNLDLGRRRAQATQYLIDSRLIAIFGKTSHDLGITIKIDSVGSTEADAKNATVDAISKEVTKLERYTTIIIARNGRIPESDNPEISQADQEAINEKQKEIQAIQTQISRLKTLSAGVYNERTSVDENGVGDTGILHGFQSVAGNYYYPVFHSQTPEDFHKRLTFLHQCTRQGAAKKHGVVDNNGTLRARNSVFGRQPICILRVGDFFYTKVIIENVVIDHAETTWDMNPENFGMQPMLSKVTLQMKLIGGQSLKGPIDALQNAVSFNYYANSSFSDNGIYALPTKVANNQESYMAGVLTIKEKELTNEYGSKIANNALLIPKII